MQEYRVFTNPSLILPPMARAAYSDRMALMCAEMSALSYIPFENPAEDPVLDKLVADIRAGKNVEQAKAALLDFLHEFKTYKKGKAVERLKEYLSLAGFELENTYNMLGTQAFLAKRHVTIDGEFIPNIAVLSFRGTEKKIEDWRTDLDAAVMYVDGIGYHPGFRKAFDTVKEDMQKDIEPLLEQGYKLYVTGHSLGGALALFAARHFDCDKVAACYTFGSPRVADYAFAYKMKTPIYRVVNARDIVPRTPPEILPHIIVFLLNILMFPFRDFLIKIISNYMGYVHHGDLRYLTRGKDERAGNFEHVQLLCNPSVIHRTAWWFKHLFDWKGPVRDHSIQLYCDKLRAYAERRN